MSYTYKDGKMYDQAGTQVAEYNKDTNKLVINTSRIDGNDNTMTDIAAAYNAQKPKDANPAAWFKPAESSQDWGNGRKVLDATVGYDANGKASITGEFNQYVNTNQFSKQFGFSAGEDGKSLKLNASNEFLNSVQFQDLKKDLDDQLSKGPLDDSKLDAMNKLVSEKYSQFLEDDAKRNFKLEQATILYGDTAKGKQIIDVQNQLTRLMQMEDSGKNVDDELIFGAGGKDSITSWGNFKKGLNKNYKTTNPTYDQLGDAFQNATDIFNGKQGFQSASYEQLFDEAGNAKNERVKEHYKKYGNLAGQKSIEADGEVAKALYTLNREDFKEKGLYAGGNFGNAVEGQYFRFLKAMKNFGVIGSVGQGAAEKVFGTKEGSFDELIDHAEWRTQYMEDNDISGAAVWNKISSTLGAVAGIAGDAFVLRGAGSAAKAGTAKLGTKILSNAVHKTFVGAPMTSTLINTSAKVSKTGAVTTNIIIGGQKINTAASATNTVFKVNKVKMATAQILSSRGGQAAAKLLDSKTGKAIGGVAKNFAKDMVEENVKHHLQKAAGNKNSVYSSDPIQYFNDYKNVLTMNAPTVEQTMLKGLGIFDLVSKGSPLVGYVFKGPKNAASVQINKAMYKIGESKFAKWYNDKSPTAPPPHARIARQLGRKFVAEWDQLDAKGNRKFNFESVDDAIHAKKLLDYMSSDPKRYSASKLKAVADELGHFKKMQDIEDLIQSHNLGTRVEIDLSKKTNSVNEALAAKKVKPGYNILSPNTVDKLYLYRDMLEAEGAYQKAKNALAAKGEAADEAAIAKLDDDFSKKMAGFTSAMEELGGMSDEIEELYHAINDAYLTIRRTGAELGIINKDRVEAFEADPEFQNNIIKQFWQNNKTGIDELDAPSRSGVKSTAGLDGKRTGESKTKPVVDPYTAIQKHYETMETRYQQTLMKDLARLNEMARDTSFIRKYADGEDILTGTIFGDFGISQRSKVDFKKGNIGVSHETVEASKRRFAESRSPESWFAEEGGAADQVEFMVKDMADEAVINIMKEKKLSFQDAAKEFSENKAFQEQIFNTVFNEAMARRVTADAAAKSGSELSTIYDAVDFALDKYRSVETPLMRVNNNEIAKLESSIINKKASDPAYKKAIERIDFLKAQNNEEFVKEVLKRGDMGDFADKLHKPELFEKQQHLSNLTDEQLEIENALEEHLRTTKENIKHTKDMATLANRAFKTLENEKAGPVKQGKAYEELKIIFNKKELKHLYDKSGRIPADNIPIAKQLAETNANKMIKELQDSQDAMAILSKDKLKALGKDISKARKELSEMTKRYSLHNNFQAGKSGTPKVFEGHKTADELRSIIDSAEMKLENARKDAHEIIKRGSTEEIAEATEKIGEATAERAKAYQDVFKLFDQDITNLENIKNQTSSSMYGEKVRNEIKHKIHQQVGKSYSFYKKMSEQEFIAKNIKESLQKRIEGSLFTNDNVFKDSNFDPNDPDIIAAENDLVKMMEDSEAAVSNPKLWGKASAVMSKSFRLFTTVLNPTGVLRNPIRDSIQSTVLSNGSFGALGAMVKRVKGAELNWSKFDADSFAKHAMETWGVDSKTAFQAWEGYQRVSDSNLGRQAGNLENSEIVRATGTTKIPGPDGTTFNMRVQSAIDWLKSEGTERLYGKTYTQRLRDGGIKNAVDAGMYWIQKPADAFETATRAMNYQHTLISGWELGGGTKKAHMQAVDNANWAAANFTTDFSRKFKMTRHYAKSVSYLNSAFAGANSFKMLFEVDPLGVATNITTKLIAPVMYFWAYNNTGDRKTAYEQIPEYIKDTNIVILLPNGRDGNGKPAYNMITLPLPQEFAKIQSGIHHLARNRNESFLRFAAQTVSLAYPVDFDGFFKNEADEATGHNPDLGERLFRGFSRIGASYLPNVARAAYEVSTNKDLYTAGDLYKTPGKFLSGIFGFKDDSEDPAATRTYKFLHSFFGGSTDMVINALDTFAGVKEEERGGANVIDSTKAAFFQTVAQSKSDKSGGKNYHLSNSLFYTGIDRLEDKKKTLMKDVDELESKKWKTEEGSKERSAIDKQIEDKKKQFGEEVSHFLKAWHGKFGKNELYRYTDKEEGAILQLLNLGQNSTTLSGDKILESQQSEAEMAARADVWRHYLSMGLPVNPSSKNMYKNTLDGLKGASYKMADEAEYLVKQKVPGMDKTLTQVASDYRSKIFDATKVKNYDLADALNKEYTENYLLPLLQGLANKYTAQGVANSSAVRNALRNVTIVPYDFTTKDSSGKKVFMRKNDNLDRQDAFLDSYLKHLWKPYEKDIKYDMFQSDSRAKYNLDRVKALREANDLTGARALAQQLKRRVDRGEMALTKADYDSLNF